MAVEKVEVQVDVDTKGAAKNIDALNKKVETSIGDFDNLNEAISKTQDTLGKIDPKSAQFKELSKELAGLKDRLRDTEVQSVRFTEALAKQPGVIGLVGQSLEGLRGTMKVFMANPIIAVVAGIAGAFLLLKESLTKTTEGQETLNRISAAFGKIIGPVMAIVEKVALPIFEKFADLLALVAEGFNKFARFLGVSQTKIEEASRNSSEVLKTAYDEEQKRQEDLTKKQEEETRKRLEQQQKEAEERKRIVEEANKIQLEAELSLLSDRDRQLKERELRYQEELAALKKAGFTNFKAFEEEYRKDVFQINADFDEKELQKRKDADDKLKAQREKAAEEAKQKLEEYIQFNIDAKQFETDALEFIQDQQVANIQSVGSILTQVAGKNKKLAIAGLVLEQGAAIAKVVIDTARAISSASAAAAPFMANPLTAIPATANLARVIAQQKIAAGISIAGIIAGAAQGISQINSAQIEGSSSGGSAGGGGASVPSYSTPSAVGVPQIQTNVGQTTGTQIASTIGRAQQQPIKAYVVSTDISSNQALDRRTNGAATFGG